MISILVFDAERRSFTILFNISEEVKRGVVDVFMSLPKNLLKTVDYQIKNGGGLLGGFY